MSKKRVFISFDYDHDECLKNLLVGQSRNTDSPFSVVDMSIKEAITVNWKAEARKRIKSCDVVIVICGCNTDTATGINAELLITQEEGVDYFMLWGYSDRNCVKPKCAKSSDIIYKWTWDNLKKLIGGAR